MQMAQSAPFFTRRSTCKYLFFARSNREPRARMLLHSVPSSSFYEYHFKFFLDYLVLRPVQRNKKAFKGPYQKMLRFLINLDQSSRSSPINKNMTYITISDL